MSENKYYVYNNWNVGPMPQPSKTQPVNMSEKPREKGEGYYEFLGKMSYENKYRYNEMKTMLLGIPNMASYVKDGQEYFVMQTGEKSIIPVCYFYSVNHDDIRVVFPLDKRIPHHVGNGVMVRLGDPHLQGQRVNWAGVIIDDKPDRILGFKSLVTEVFDNYGLDVSKVLTYRIDIGKGIIDYVGNSCWMDDSNGFASYATEETKRLMGQPSPEFTSGASHRYWTQWPTTINPTDNPTNPISDGRDGR